MRTILISCACVIAVISLPMRAQDTATSADRFRALEDRIRALESQVAELQTALEVSGPAPTPVAPAAPAAEVVPQTAPTPEPVLGGAGGMAKALNPDIGIIGNFVGSTGRNNVNAYPSLSLQESEVSFQAIVDPYARADFFLAVGEEGIEVEEGYVTFPALPGNFLLKAGKMRSTFTRVNTFHNHTLPWIDRPMVQFNLMGGSLD
ncbi:MAG: hypothetical protein HY651_01270, partial [Acidobacteria bacterium]|nr:hypothetical protein [Acidobacteriota bacterium]